MNLRQKTISTETQNPEVSRDTKPLGSDVNRADARILLAHRLVQAGILISILWKLKFFLHATAVYRSIELIDPFFPSFWRSNSVLHISFVGVVAAAILNLITTSSSIRKTCNLASITGLSILCTHQASYNDATFVTAWWCAIWSWWFGSRMNRDTPDQLLSKAAFLSRLIISMILLGGAVGKWTNEYWSGEVLYDIYFVDRDYWVFNFLRDQFSTEELKRIAMWHSRNVVMMETAAGLFLWTLSDRMAATAGILFLTSIAVFSNLLLFSVVGCLIALALVGYIPRDEP